MAKKNTFYITTAIDYVNAKPHVGHAFEKTIADTLARYKRLQGKKVFFLTGVDENAQKNVQAAEKAGISVKEFVDKNTSFFLELCNKLNISQNDFIRTSAKEHAEVVQRLVTKMIDKGDIYRGDYEGLYCVGCETYYTEKDLVNGKCPEHNTEPELRKEAAYFFKLSKYKSKLLEIIPDYVTPESRANEVLTRVKEELNDICVSRKGATWGIDFPNDPDFKIWVWIDALINYISGLKEKEQEYWPADVHVIGKGINWFHSVIWPAILLSAEYELPKSLLVHGYLKNGDRKMSKSLGNVIDPLELLDKYPADVVRYSLLKCSVFEDSDYSEELLIKRNNEELANKLGNLVSRVSTLDERYGLEKTTPLDSKTTVSKVNDLMNNYEFDRALNEIFAFIDVCNEYIQNKKPWESEDKKVLYQLTNAIKDFTILLSPFIPETAEKIARIFNFEISLKTLESPIKITKIKKSEILFKKIETTQKPKMEEKSKIKEKSNNSIIEINEKGSMQESLAKSKEIIEGKIPYEDFAKIELRIGKILEVTDHPKADKLLVLTVDFAEGSPRTIVAGLKKQYKKEDLKGKKAVFVTNLEPANLRGVESNGMILAAVSADESQVVFIEPEKDIKEGSKLR